MKLKYIGNSGIATTWVFPGLICFRLQLFFIILTCMAKTRVLVNTLVQRTHSYIPTHNYHCELRTPDQLPEEAHTCLKIIQDSSCFKF